ncbi:hypothetical protein DFH07DRAFT_317254 [Mycena maculata]|uniref:Uncharacterized protein n=1 Tax=Mycena maculata TaxID=230809 RepID=A0AAD7HEJ7_9AGAR|nr:hypothetical protein DFH07DRAFT_317254 [Mycena maculata]
MSVAGYGPPAQASPLLAGVPCTSLPVSCCPASVYRGRDSPLRVPDPIPQASEECTSREAICPATRTAGDRRIAETALSPSVRWHRISSVARWRRYRKIIGPPLTRQPWRCLHCASPPLVDLTHWSCLGAALQRPPSCTLTVPVPVVRCHGRGDISVLRHNFSSTLRAAAMVPDDASCARYHSGQDRRPV